MHHAVRSAYRALANTTRSGIVVCLLASGIQFAAPTVALAEAAAPVAMPDPQSEALIEPAVSTSGVGFSSDGHGCDGDTAVMGGYYWDEARQDFYPAVAVLSRSGDTWTEQQRLDSDLTDFGTSCDVDGDTAVVAFYGGVDVYTRVGETWTYQQVIPLVLFGDYRVAIDGDTIVVGDPNRKTVYTYTRVDGVWYTDATITNTFLPDWSFGYSVAVDGDTVAVGSAGAGAYIYTRSEGVWVEQLRCAAPGLSRYCMEVDVSGDTVIVGEFTDLLEGGSVGIYARDGGVWSLQQRLDPPGEQYFGRTVSVSGDTAVVGVSDFGYGASEGIRVYRRSGAEWTREFEHELGGGAVELSGDTALVEGSHFLKLPAGEYRVAEDGVFTIGSPGVLANDVDAGMPLGSLVATQPTDPAHGTVTLDASGSFTYTPDADWFGADTFTYRAFDGTTYSAPAAVTVTVTPVNDAPVAVDDGAACDVDGSATGNVLDNDTDVDGDALTATFVSDPAHGELDLAGDGTFTYTPAPGWSGTDSFTYEASDGEYSDVAEVTIRVGGNNPPVASDDRYRFRTSTALSVAAGSGVLADDTDANGDPLTAVLDSPPTRGALVLNDDGSFTYTPAPGYRGDDSFTYSAFDGTDYSAPATVELIGQKRYEQDNAALGYTGAWSSLARTQYSGGSARYASGTAKSVTATFTGTGIDWVGAKSTSAGKARVYLDGVLVATVDLYSNLNRFQQVLYSVSDLPEGTHTLKIECINSKSTASSGTNVWIDCLDVMGDLTGAS